MARSPHSVQLPQSAQKYTTSPPPLYPCPDLTPIINSTCVVAGQAAHGPCLVRGAAQFSEPAGSKEVAGSSEGVLQYNGCMPQEYARNQAVHLAELRAAPTYKAA
eukprot:1160090-Pelagomonas_calceolata.AAC.4